MNVHASLFDATAIVLAGGKSSRMGRPKALLPFDGQPLIAHIVSTLRRLFAEIVVVGAPEQDLPSMDVVLVRDDVAYQGPVAGIFHGLTAATREIAFVTSCDSAFLNTGLIAHLVSRVSDHDVVVPWWEGRYQPLHAVYRRSVRPLLEAQLARGELRPVFLFDRVRTLRIDEDEIRRFDPDGSTFFNMNTPEEYAEALDRWRRLETAANNAMDDRVECTVELFGVAQMLAHVTEVPLVLPAPATFAQALAALADRVPALVGRVIAADRGHLVDGYACNVNGAEFVRDAAATIHPRDRLLILSADAGG